MSIKERIRRAEAIFNSQIEPITSEFLKSERTLHDFDVFASKSARIRFNAGRRVVAFEKDEQKLYDDFIKRISATEGKAWFLAWDKLPTETQRDWEELSGKRKEDIFNRIHEKKNTLNITGKAEPKIKPSPASTVEERIQEFIARMEHFEQLMEKPEESYARDIGKSLKELTKEEQDAASLNKQVLQIQIDVCVNNIRELKNAQKVVDKTNI